MSLETKESSENAIVIRGKDNDEDAVKFANLYFIHTFLLFAVDTAIILWLYFNLVESGRYSDYPWGTVAIKELSKTLNKKLKLKGKFYMLHGMPLAIQVWLYECCSTVPHNFASKVDKQIPHFLNWKTNAPCPRYESLMESMFNEADDKSPDLSSSSTEDEVSVVTKKVFEKFRNQVREELNSIRDLVSSSFDQLMIAITENKPEKPLLSEQGVDGTSPKLNPTTEGPTYNPVGRDSGMQGLLLRITPSTGSCGVKENDLFALKNAKQNCKKYTGWTRQGTAGSGAPLWARHRGTKIVGSPMHFLARRHGTLDGLMLSLKATQARKLPFKMVEN
ncbi:hypothetical protein BC332_25780 [Capsicum chinense]|nr:hypothetical protein BC332_25780 [Capsicum chinense]